MFADTILGMGRASLFESGSIDPDIENVTPDTVYEECIGDPFEYLTGVYYESQLDMLNINQAIMVCEYAYLQETGYEMVYEANVITNMLHKVHEKAKSAWNKICAFFKSIFTWLESRVREDKKFVDKYKGTVTSIKSVDIGKFKGYTFSPAAASLDVNGDAIASRASQMLKALSATATGLHNGHSSYADTNVSDYMNKLRGDLIAKGPVEAGDFAKEVGELFRGKEVELSTVSGNELKTMLDVISSTKVTKAKLNTVYVASKSQISAILATCKALEKAADASSNEKDSNDAKSFHVLGTILNSMVGLTTIINNKAVKALTAHNRQCRAVVAKAVNAYNKNGNAKENSGGGKDLPALPQKESFIDSVFDAFDYI